MKKLIYSFGLLSALALTVISCNKKLNQYNNGPKATTSKNKHDSLHGQPLKNMVKIRILDSVNRAVKGALYNDGISTYTTDSNGEIIGSFDLNDVDGTILIPNSAESISFHVIGQNSEGISSITIILDTELVSQEIKDQYLSGKVNTENTNTKIKYKDGLLLLGHYIPNVTNITDYSNDFTIDKNGFSMIKFKYEDSHNTVIRFKVKKRIKKSKTQINITLTDSGKDNNK